MSQSRNNTLKIPLYGNCRVENPDGIHIFNCGDKKAQWYLKRNLAKKINEEPLVIRLTFIPNGQGHAADSFYLQKRQNNCVCCGREEEMTKHHVVPYMYRRFFPDHLKNHTAYDILPLCHSCHEDYEIFAQQLKTEIAIELSVMKEDVKVVDFELKNVCMAASALLLHRDLIPSVRYEYLMDIVRKYYGHHEVTTAELEEASHLRYNTKRDTYKPEGQAVVESLDSIEAFVKRWRRHFITTMFPQHMPEHWTVDRPL